MTRYLPFLFAAALAGCQPETPSIPNLHPLTGTITQNGKPVTSGGLIFIPESGSWGGVIVNASVNTDGTFTAETSKVVGNRSVIFPGAPPGTYTVVFHPPGDGSVTGTEAGVPGLVTVVAGQANTAALTVPTKRPKGEGEPRDDANPPVGEPAER